MEKFDVIVIGGGPAGYAAAMRAVDYDMKVCLIEKDRVGGAGVYHGALSSKTLWEISQKVRNVNESLATRASKFDITWAEVKQTLEEAVFERKFQYSCHIKLLQEETISKKFNYERGEGRFLTDHEIEITCNDGEKKVIYGEHIILATGSTPRRLPNIIADEEVILTSDGIDEIEDFPKSMVVVGAGVIGCEYATIFSNFGKTKVYIIDRQNQILPFEDEDISKLIASNFDKNGVTIHHNANLVRMERIGDEVEYELSYPDGKSEIIRVEKALLSIGRVPNIAPLCIENAGVSMSKRGIHIGDVDTQTNVPHIYAVGDVSGRIALVNMGEIEARHAVEKINDPSIPPISYDNVSTIMFLNPEVAAVGMHEGQCLERNIPCKVVKIDYSVIARAIAMRNTQGFFKIVVTNDDKMQILGMRAVGEHASSAIQAVALLISMGKGVEEIAELVHPHPSIVEGIQECVRMLMNKSVFKSSVFKDKLHCYSLIDGVKTPLQRL